MSPLFYNIGISLLFFQLSGIPFANILCSKYVNSSGFSSATTIIASFGKSSGPHGMALHIVDSKLFPYVSVILLMVSVLARALALAHARGFC